MPPLRVRVGVVADELDQDSVGGFGMQEADEMAARTGPRHFVDERYAARVELAQRAGQIVDGKRDVMQPRAPLVALDEFLEAGVAAFGRDELDGAAGRLRRQD